MRLRGDSENSATNLKHKTGYLFLWGYVRPGPTELKLPQLSLHMPTCAMALLFHMSRVPWNQSLLKQGFTFDLPETILILGVGCSWAPQSLPQKHRAIACRRIIDESRMPSRLEISASRAANGRSGKAGRRKLSAQRLPILYGPSNSQVLRTLNGCKAWTPAKQAPKRN